MPANRPNRRPAAGGLLMPRIALPLILLLCIGLLVPCAAAADIHEYYNDAVDNSESNVDVFWKYIQGEPRTTGNLNSIYLVNAENYQYFSYFAIEVPANVGYWDNGGGYIEPGTYPITCTYNGHDIPATLYLSRQTNLLGSITSTRFLVLFDGWNNDGLTGGQYINFPFVYYSGSLDRGGLSTAIRPAKDSAVWWPVTYHLKYSSANGQFWENMLDVTDDGIGYDIELSRTLGTHTHPSTIIINNGGTQVFTNSQTINLKLWYSKEEITDISIISPRQTYLVSLGSSSESSQQSNVTIYVQNSQTGALLANARLTIQDTTTDPWTEVVNETLSSGQGSFSLPKDTGLHLTQYRIGATVPGYQQVVPALFARVTGPTNIVVEMEPLAGGPADPDNTYLEFYVRDLNANGIANANVLVDGKTRWTNGQGYTQFEVAKNATYPYTVSKSGYMTIQGSAIVADGPRYVANVVLGPGTVPTYTPTLGPGETPGGPGATPTPDTRTNEQKGQAIIDLIADFAEPIAILAILATIFGLMKMMTPGRR